MSEGAWDGAGAGEVAGGEPHCRDCGFGVLAPPALRPEQQCLWAVMGPRWCPGAAGEVQGAGPGSGDVSISQEDAFAACVLLPFLSHGER